MASDRSARRFIHLLKRRGLRCLAGTVQNYNTNLSIPYSHGESRKRNSRFQGEQGGVVQGNFDAISTLCSRRFVLFLRGLRQNLSSNSVKCAAPRWRRYARKGSVDHVCFWSRKDLALVYVHRKIAFSPLEELRREPRTKTQDAISGISGSYGISLT